MRPPLSRPRPSGARSRRSYRHPAPGLKRVPKTCSTPILVLAIFALAALWRFTPPPRTLAIAEPAQIHIHAPKAMADITVTPGRVGR